MKAVRVHRFGGPEVLQLDEDIPIPEPGPGQVLVRVHAVGINPVEALVRSGAFHMKPPLPYSPGTDLGGQVVKLGEGVTNVKVNDRIYTLRAQGGYAQYSLVGAEDVVPLSDKITYEQGAAIGIPYLTAYRALFTKAHAKEGETLLIHGGTGGVGIASIQLGLAHKLRVLATGGTEAGLEMMKKLGAHHVFNHRKEGYHQEILDATSGEGADIIVEVQANTNLDNDFKLAKPAARILVIGTHGRADIDPAAFFMKEIDIHGISLFKATKEDLAESYLVLGKDIESGHIRPVIGKRFKLEQAAEAHTDIMNSKGAMGKSVFVVD